MFFRHLSPDEHSAPRFFHFPADSSQAIADHITPGLILLVLFDHILLAVPQRDNAGYLDRLEDAVIVITFYRGEIIDHIPVARHEADAEARHVVGLAHRSKFDADILRPFDRKEARRLVAVEAGLAVCKAVNHGHTELFA